MPQILSNGATIIIAVLLVLAITYRFYARFIGAKVLALDVNRQTPAHRFNDGKDYHPTNKWVLFGHHFAAISGAGPLIGPVLAAQFGYLPGLLWILIGVCLAGAVQDFIVLVLSIRRNGKSIAQIAFTDIGPAAGTAATIGILFVLVIAIAGLGKVVTSALGGETQTFQTGTEFIDAQGMIIGSNKYDNAFVYRIPTGASIKIGEAIEPVNSQMEITAIPVDSRVAIDIDDSYKSAPRPARVEPGAAPITGFHLTVPSNVHVVTNYDGSIWGTFTIALTIPIALFIGAYLYRIRKNRVLEASIIGGILTLGAVYVGGLGDVGHIPDAVGDWSIV